MNLLGPTQVVWKSFFSQQFDIEHEKWKAGLPLLLEGRRSSERYLYLEKQRFCFPPITFSHPCKWLSR